MKQLNSYIFEKLHIGKNSEFQHEDDLINILSKEIKKYLQDKRGLYPVDYIYGFYNKKGEITNKDEEISTVIIKLVDIKDAVFMSNDLTYLLNEYKEIKHGTWDPKNKTITIYFR